MVKIAHQTDPNGDVIEVIAVYVASVDLFTPAISYFDLAISGGAAVSNYKLISETVLHFAYLSMVILECACISLSRSTVVNNNVFPAVFLNRSPIDLVPYIARQIFPTAEPTKK